MEYFTGTVRQLIPSPHLDGSHTFGEAVSRHAVEWPLPGGEIRNPINAVCGQEVHELEPVPWRPGVGLGTSWCPQCSARVTRQG
jgi:hypothetical protein